MAGDSKFVGRGSHIRQVNIAMYYQLCEQAVYPLQYDLAFGKECSNLAKQSERNDIWINWMINSTFIVKTLYLFSLVVLKS